MAIIIYHNVGVKAMAACVPSTVAYNKDLACLMSQEEIDKMINSIGIHERRISPVDVCASDLCYKAALKLMEDNQIDPESIDVPLFVSQTSDYHIPATSCVLQRRLGLSKVCACLDLTSGCSGYICALSTVYVCASMEGINRVLLLDGETSSKIVNPRDKVNVPLCGDTETATLVEKGAHKDFAFILNTDGTGADAVKMHGGMRHSITSDSCLEKEREDGNYRTDMETLMDGMDVLNFVISVVFKGVKETMKIADSPLEDTDYLVLHQSNKFMIDFFVKRLKFDETKVPYCIVKYGNTSSAFVPLTIVSELSEKLNEEKVVVMCGFGAGLSWVAARIVYNECHISLIVEYRVMLSDFKFHHIGMAVFDIDDTAQYYIDAGHQKTETVIDTIQNVKICFLMKEGMSTLEPLAPADENSPVNRTLDKVGVTSYHCCHSVDDMEGVIARLKKVKSVPLIKAMEACAIGGRRVCFLFNKKVGSIELVES